MSYYPKNDAYLYKDEAIVFNVGRETKDSYSIQIRCIINENNEATIKTSVCKNSSYNLKTENTKPDRKYKEENLFFGTFGECVEYIKNIVESQGYWKNDPEQPFREIFIEPISIV